MRYYLRYLTLIRSYILEYESRSSAYGESPSMSKFTDDKLLSYSNFSDDDDDNYKNWTISKRKVNHKTRQVETRVSHPVILESGRIVSEDGPQVVTCIKEENKVEECDEQKEPKAKGSCENLSETGSGSSERIFGEKRQVNRVSRETREENMHYHDNRFKGLTGLDVHERAIKEPHALITITDKESSVVSNPRGKMLHYSNKGKKFHDTDEIIEVAKVAIDGSITKEVKRTNRHEEFSEDEMPDETGEAEALKETGPTISRSSRRHVDYVNDFDDIDAPLKGEGSTRGEYQGSKLLSNESRSREAFPPYEIDPLLNSLRDEDFKPRNHETKGQYIEHPIRQAQM